MSDAERLSVLVVEDDAQAARAYATLLGVCGFHTRTAGDGVEALELAAADAPDVALVDIRLPKVDGWSVARELTRIAGRRPLLVALTALSQPGDEARSLAAGFDAHITKPVDPDALLGLLRRFGRLIAETDRQPAAVG
jgi:two-component system CheB/CheR fusion protein